ncbi:sulfate/molybdate ABC transporter ATP-binding protein [Nocardia rhizosphaerae]|uniref:Sulfate/molybdate ABC transporter ATP-binding protein n=1 Tax=Nocardia rhizosphaerae TaxID=1691571 RepID=A0ABV8KZF8_9NOCA
MVEGDGLSVVARIEGRDLDLRVDVAPGEVLAVLGPNGAGKSSLLEVIAGLVVPDHGRVRLGGRTLTDTARGIALPPHRRGVALLAQDPLLFPHLSVHANVAFGPRSRGARHRAAKAIADDWLAAVDATELAARAPAALSGGQAQRVALARALAVDPDLLLLDEPMSALDVDVAPAMRTLLRRVLRDEPGRANPRCAVLVTHDIIDAITLADRIVVVEGGRIVEAGTVTDVMSRPRSPFAARIAGLNLVHGTAIPPARPQQRGPTEPITGERSANTESASAMSGRPSGAGTELGEPVHRDEVSPIGPEFADKAGHDPALGAIQVGRQRVDGRVVGDFVPGASAAAVFSPAAVAVFTTAPAGSPRNVFPVEVADIADHGGVVRVRGESAMGGLAADLTPAAVAQLGLVLGARVDFVVKATEIRVYAC